MGLDIRAYRKISPAPDSWWDEEGEYIAEGYWDVAMLLYPHPGFPGRDEGVPKAKVYSFEDRIGFRAGSYSGYSSWREWLAELAGYPEIEYETRYSGRIKSRAAACYIQGMTGAFSELINFSDCEGVIGPVVAMKLLKDFKDFEEKASTHDSWNYGLYLKWKEAFEYAADDGAIQFA